MSWQKDIKVALFWAVTWECCFLLLWNGANHEHSCPPKTFIILQAFEMGKVSWKMESGHCHQLHKCVNKGNLTHSTSWDSKYLRREIPLPSFHLLIHVKQITLTSRITVSPPVPANLGSAIYRGGGVAVLTHSQLYLERYRFNSTCACKQQ